MKAQGKGGGQGGAASGAWGLDENPNSELLAETSRVSFMS